MQSIMVGLLFKSVIMTFIGILYVVVTPFLLKRYSAKWLYYSWLAILIGFILPFTFKISKTIVHLSEPMQLPSMELVPAKSSEITLMASTVETMSSLSIWHVLMSLWIGGIILFLAVHLFKHYRFMQTVNRWGQLVVEPHTLQLLEQVKEEMTITKEISLKQSSCIHSPMLTGFIKQTIWLPINDYEKQELNMILKHELVHLQRKDLWFKAFILFVSAIHWFNPLFYRFAKELDQLCELACDDEVIKNSDDPLRKTYSQAILHTEMTKKPIGVFSTNFAGNSHFLQKRIHAIMSSGKKKSGIFILIIIILLITGGTAISSAFAVSSTPINYLDETFMKESILNGASRGNFTTDYLIVDSTKGEKTVPAEPSLNNERYQNRFSAGVIGTEARYRYPVEIVHKEYGEKFTTVIYIDYDYELLAPIELDELNSLIESYLLPVNELKSVSFADFTAPNYVENRLADFIQAIDQKNIDERVAFYFSFSGLATNNNYLPALNQYPIATTPRYMKSTP